MSAAGVPVSEWFPGEIHAEVVVALAAIGVAYVAGWRARGERISVRHVGSFFSGLAAVLVALNGPLHDLSDRFLFSAHMIQHLVLALVFPPLVLAGTPAWMVDALLERFCRVRLLAWLVRHLTRPVAALAAYTIALVVWHLPAPFELALESHGVHVLEHVTLMAGALLAWWPVVSPSAIAPPLHYGARILYLFVFGIPMTIVAAMITGAETVLYPFYAAAPRVTSLAPLADQQLGGLTMWVPAGLIPLIAFTIVFFRWVAAERDDADEVDGSGLEFPQ